ncbi:MAG: hypothetical protein R2795_21500 [Saprospiraceae bacterium]
MITMRFATALLALTITLGAYAQESPLMRFPALNPDGTKVAFSWQGDIWVASVAGGAALRLTIHESYESHPQWSPDGQRIAFQGNRYGNNDIFVVGADGGTPQRLTWHSTSDRYPQWVDNERLLFITDRLYGAVERESEVYTVSLRGETPTRMFDALAQHATPYKGGQWIAYTTGECRFEREAYTGPANRNIWVYNQNTRQYTSLAANDAQDTQPDWAGGQLFYLSATNGRYNVYRQAMTDAGACRGNPLPLRATKT